MLRRKFGAKQLIPLLHDMEPIGIEACATAYHWAGAHCALGVLKLMPPAHVKA